MVRLVLICMMLSLSACQDQTTDVYLISHPDALATEVNQCRFGQMAGEASHCEKMLQLAKQRDEFLNEQSFQPEQFGEELLNAQLACQQALAALRQAKSNLNTLKTHQASSSDLQIGEEKLQLAKQAYLKQKAEVEVRLAIIGLNRPE